MSVALVVAGGTGVLRIFGQSVRPAVKEVDAIAAVLGCDWWGSSSDGGGGVGAWCGVTGAMAWLVSWYPVAWAVSRRRRSLSCLLKWAWKRSHVCCVSSLL
jgi:hypothetical protein